MNDIINWKKVNYILKISNRNTTDKPQYQILTKINTINK